MNIKQFDRICKECGHVDYSFTANMDAPQNNPMRCYDNKRCVGCGKVTMFIDKEKCDGETAVRS